MTGRAAAALIAAGFFVCAAATVARAQGSPPPIGFWTNEAGNEQLNVSADGNCGFGANGTYSVVGACSWNPSAQGGILTIVNQNQYQPAPIYYNILWINQTTISVYGDVMVRRD